MPHTEKMTGNEIRKAVLSRLLTVKYMSAVVKTIMTSFRHILNRLYAVSTKPENVFIRRTTAPKINTKICNGILFIGFTFIYSDKGGGVAFRIARASLNSGKESNAAHPAIPAVQHNVFPSASPVRIYRATSSADNPPICCPPTYT